MKVKFFIVLFTIFLLSSCKGKPDVKVKLYALDPHEDEIEYEFTAKAEGDNFAPSDKGIYWGTTQNLLSEGNKKSHSSGDVENMVSSVSGIESNTTYYFQVYAVVKENEYLSDQLSVTTSAGWKDLNNSPTGDFYSLALTPSGIVHVVGNNGLHYFSSDEGETWSQIIHSNSDYLFDIKFIDENNAFMRAGNLIRKSTDGGMSWTDISLPTSFIETVFFYDPDVFFYSDDDTIYSTHNGGSSWNAGYTPSYAGNGQATSIHFLSPTLGYAVSYSGDITKSTDGGNTWTMMTSSPIYGNAKQIWFVNENNGVVGLSFNVYTSTDGGVIWDHKFGSVGDFINEIDFYNDQVGIVAADDGILARTFDGGLNWSFDYISNDDRDFKDVELFSPDIAYAIDDTGVILKFE